MSRHFWRACRGESGVTLMELLVAMIIAAVFFAAATPFFVQAISVGSGDRMRAIAMNAAQDRIEKLHQLDYDSIKVENLNDPAFYPVDVGGTPHGFFGPTWSVQTASGVHTLTVSYTVDTKAATTDSAPYKLVTITVSWTKPQGTETESLTNKTVVYRQFAGPQITLFTLNPEPSTQTINGVTKDSLINSTTVQLTVTINAGNIPAMRPVVVGGQTLRGFVKFTATSESGASTTLVAYYNSTDETHYTTTWTVPGGAGVGDGYYTFTAIAYTASRVQGNSWTRSGFVESGPPAAVTGLLASGAKDVNGVNLTWTGSTSSDLDHYLVTRSGGVAFTPVTLAKGSTAYSDGSAVANTAYTYTVTGYDVFGKTSTASTTTQWVDPGAPPNQVLNLKGSQSSATDNHITLSWDPPTALAGVTIAGYKVYAAGNTTTPVDTVTGTSDTTITQNWGSTQYYQVKAFSTVGGALSNDWALIAVTTPAQSTVSVGGTPWLNVAVGAEPLYTLNVTNNVAKNTWFTLWYRGVSGTGDSRPGGVEPEGDQGGRCCQLVRPARRTVHHEL